MALHVMDEANHCLGCKVPRCQQGCPIHTNIPEVIRLLKANKLDEAGRMLFENNPLTTVCSLVCNHENQCEGHCVRGIKGAPVHFSVIENYISSTYASQMTQGPAPSDGKISNDEIDDFIHIRQELERISLTVETLQLWTERMLANGQIDAETYKRKLEE